MICPALTTNGGLAVFLHVGLARYLNLGHVDLGFDQALAGRRAESVQNALVGMGVARERIAARGYGESYPVASNDNAGGRQLTRRVEIVLSDDSGKITPR